ncbi:cell cycle regulator protein [Brevundimonas phage vB_BpoS-Kikimora]|uniref:Cell cycle regulator protein n=1 Tax=Brevundimonas phage vB_BpoS-Kikimora TaxID=2948601 RepID=A0A9E7SKW3_9CAUD|nr:cell cycle regulator protein [Brevundimonas phage vB_BpoS-Kikimora]
MPTSDDWRGIGDWDDMDVPVDPKERAELRAIQRRRDNRPSAPRQQHNEWPEPEVALMVQLWQEGKTAAEISRQLGTRSRSSVLGRLNRMGLRRDDLTNTQTQRQSSQVRATFKPRRGRKVQQSIGSGKGRIADDRRRRPVETAEVLTFAPAAPVLIEDFDDVSLFDLHALLAA